MFHGRSLWPSIKGTESKSWVAASSLSSNGAPKDNRTDDDDKDDEES